MSESCEARPTSCCQFSGELHRCQGVEEMLEHGLGRYVECIIIEQDIVFELYMYVYIGLLNMILLCINEDRK